MRRVQSFDDVEHEQPVTINAYHGTTPYNAEQIKQQGFKFGPEVERNGFTPEFEKRLGRKHLLGNGIYFADEQRKKHYGQYGGGSLHKVEVTLQKPYVVHHGSWAELKKLDPDGLKAQGYDGIVVKQGKYGLYGGENYRQGVAFHPHSIKIVDAHEPVRELLPHAKVRHAVTGEKGVVRRVTKVSDAHREWMKQNKPEAEQPPANWVSVKWNGSKRLGTKSRVDHNVHDHHLVVTESVTDQREGRMNESRADRLIRRRLGEAIDSPSQAEALLAKFHYLPDPRKRRADDGWYAHELGHKALVIADPTFGTRFQLYTMGEGEKYDFKSGTGLVALEGALVAAHQKVYP